MKILASDFDGTIYFMKEENPFKEKDIKAILEFQGSGNKFGICTGRPLLGIVEPTNGIINYDFYILNTGSYILDKDFKVIFKKCINKTIIKKVIEDTNFDEGIHLAGVKDIHLLTDMPGWPDDVKHVDNIDDIDDEILGFSLHINNNLAKANKLVNFININYPELNAFQNKSDIDIVASGCSKAHGIEIISQYYNVNKEYMSCIGDSYNDMPMLEALSNSYTFNSSPLEVKEVSTYTVDSVNECIENIKKGDC